MKSTEKINMNIRRLGQILINDLSSGKDPRNSIGEFLKNSSLKMQDVINEFHFDMSQIERKIHTKK